MPLLIPLFTGLAGFVGGMFTGDGLSSTLKAALVLGGGFYVYNRWLK